MFNVRLKTLRKNTQAEIAELLNIQRTTYGEYERGRIHPPMDKIKKLANYFNVSVDYVMRTQKIY